MFQYLKKVFLYTQANHQFIPEVVVFHSELSNTKKCKRQHVIDTTHLNVLKLISLYKWVKASELDRMYNSWGRRANELLHLGYVDNIGKKTIMRYAINQKGTDLINNN